MTKKIYINIVVLSIVLGLIILINNPYVNLLLAFLVIVVFVFSNLNSDFNDLFQNNKSHLKLLPISLGYAILIQIAAHFVLYPVIVWFTNAPINLGPFDLVRGNLKAFTISLAIGWFVGGLLEETIFRGFLLKTFESLFPKKIGLIIGVLFSSFLFGFLHSYQGISGQLLTGTAGVFLAIIYLANNRNLWLNIYVHGMMNSISMLLIYFKIV
ncbi:hypothetical protein WH52_12270 [Tenacibaculum holothuriorum]|uniref:CAAX prenyl protease 2/Lysostaphin resistance protein A-like domain-containing protein n=1 Tax=Tenacibaculum holothuriorum TaxID=1635173 RepID=A0A1Y2PB49_9FLAO|nr:type II CAAX endopeptidase family protein [Tenacibaculum holothuriorum]OSY87231.1 hypothetical protein WH52_12270 [Tenacibaculum holothuriorum]